MVCEICTRCGRCGIYPAASIREDGAVSLPKLVRRDGIGAAVDIGSTTIVARVYDLSTGELLRLSSIYNPQRKIAADVMGRIEAAVNGGLDELCALVRGAVRDCLGGFSVDEAVVAGNTAMLHFYAGITPASFATAPFCAERLFGEWLEVDGVPTRFLRCVHGFFGADAVAAVWMAGMCGRSGCELLADIGTNGEIALWRGDTGELTVGSIAAGPAFERAGTTGSKIVAAVAEGVDSGVIEPSGRVTGVLGGGLMQADVSAVQLAKAAVCAGLNTLLKKSGTPVSEIDRFSIAGGFGSGMDAAKAARIGLFDPALLPVVSVCGNLAIEGAAAALLDPAIGDEMDGLAQRAHHVELGGDADFSAAFISALRF